MLKKIIKSIIVRDINSLIDCVYVFFILFSSLEIAIFTETLIFEINAVDRLNIDMIIFFMSTVDKAGFEKKLSDFGRQLVLKNLNSFQNYSVYCLINMYHEHERENQHLLGEDDIKSEDTLHSDDLQKQLTAGRTQPMSIERKQHGRVCYVDPNESFPQATYYVSSQVQRPAYSNDELPEETSVSLSDDVQGFGLKHLEKNVCDMCFVRDDLVHGITENMNINVEDKLNATTQEKDKTALAIETDDTADLIKSELFTTKGRWRFNLFGGKGKISQEEKNLVRQVSTTETAEPTESTAQNPLDASTTSEPVPKLGTGGVYLNVLLSIFGVIVFLRLAFVVGQAGLINYIIILFLSTMVTSLTCLSLAAICSNGLPKNGGAYYVTSRTIGPHVGSTIGLLLSIGMSVAISSYVIGFAETMRSSIGVVVTNSPINGLLLWIFNTYAYTHIHIHICMYIQCFHLFLIDWKYKYICI
ncbi:hypothetical protein RFI_39474 [Reticulomyxa filosa]|uniref:Amino acid permease/ SLC12A domain-containing protein n=1 Tax=Reticulomyxa filosa TaxID=46433 RepID=X6LBE1_RETFI|nr:hypothetical protein RFI_39474 [Reticulomyxa filosa]|eukprot:ETN98049.1 hypothetical protein RFI_39474 [Reticulomyxa filosa]